MLRLEKQLDTVILLCEAGVVASGPAAHYKYTACLWAHIYIYIIEIPPENVSRGFVYHSRLKFVP